MLYLQLMCIFYKRFPHSIIIYIINICTKISNRGGDAYTICYHIICFLFPPHPLTEDSLADSNSSKKKKSNYHQRNKSKCVSLLKKIFFFYNYIVVLIWEHKYFHVHNPVKFWVSQFITLLKMCIIENILCWDLCIYIMYVLYIFVCTTYTQIYIPTF